MHFSSGFHLLITESVFDIQVDFKRDFTGAMRDVPCSSTWKTGDQKARREMERSLDADPDDHVARFTLVRLLAKRGDCVAAEV